MDEGRVGRLEHVATEAEGVQLPRVGRLDQHVGSGDEVEQCSAVVGSAGIDHDRPLAPVVRPVEEAPIDALDVAEEGPDPSAGGAAGRFDQDHVGPQVGQDLAAQLAALVGQVQHPVGRQHEPPLPSGRCRRAMPAGDAGQGRRCRTERPPVHSRGRSGWPGHLSGCQSERVLHLRLIVPPDLTPAVVDHLRADPGVAHIVQLPAAAVVPRGDVVVCDVVREAANEVVEWLQGLGVHHQGAITVEMLEAAVSDAAERAEAEAAGHASDALVWEELEDRSRTESALTVSFLVFMAVAAMIAAVGILLDSPILIVGAMVVGPEYGPLAALCVAIVRRRREPAGTAARTLGSGLGVAAGAACWPRSSSG